MWLIYMWHGSFHTHCNTLQHTATHYNFHTHTATHCCTLQHTATHCNTLQHTATHCYTLLHTATTHFNTLQHNTWLICMWHDSFHTHCNTLQHTSTHCKIICGSFICDMTPSMHAMTYLIYKYVWVVSHNIESMTWLNSHIFGRKICSKDFVYMT